MSASTKSALSRMRHLCLLAEKYPSRAAVNERRILLKARLVLPKGVEHFMSDLHGEYRTFTHILNNCSGVIREKVDYVFGDRMTAEEKAEFCTLIYHPREKLEQLARDGRISSDWYRKHLALLLEISKLMSFKYPSEMVHGFLPHRFDTVIMELMGTHPEADSAQFAYHRSLLHTIAETSTGADYIVAFTVLIKRLAIDRMHIVGDFFDRGPRPDAILDQAMRYPSLDLQWGNHDVLWMGATCGNDACIANVVRNSLRYNNTDVLEKGYAIALRPLIEMAKTHYPDDTPVKAAERAISIMLFKVEGALIRRRPEFAMESRMLLERIDFKKNTIRLDDGKTYPINQISFPTVDPDDPYRLTEEEAAVMDGLRDSFTESAPLQQHIDFLYRCGSAYTCYNGNLLFHACIPMDAAGKFTEIRIGEEAFSGRALMDAADRMARRAHRYRDEEALDYLWYFWCGLHSPFCGREVKTFERMLIDDETAWAEASDPYFAAIDNPAIAEAVLTEFGLDASAGHIVNGHVPVRRGESPIKAGGKAIVIDGGFCHAYRDRTGIAGLTLISNSRALRLLTHQTIADVRESLRENRDIESVSETIELQSRRSTVADIDEGIALQAELVDLQELLDAYECGVLQEQNPLDR